MKRDNIKRNVRICIFCECWESGGIESFLYNVLKNINTKSMEIDIVAAQIKPSIFSESVAAMGINLIELSGSQKKLAENHSRFAKLLAERKYDVLHLNIFHAVSFKYGAIAKRLGVPKRIVHSHNSALRKSSTRAVKFAVHKVFGRLYYKAFTDYWACSSSAAKFMFPSKITARKNYEFIPNGINIERFAFDPQKRVAFREKLGIKDTLLIVSIGRLCQQKNQSFLLEVAKKLCDKKNDFRLLLVGEGELMDELKEKADGLSVDDKVIFYGTTSDVPSVLSGADVFAFPSLFEGLGIVAVEAQAAALPVICSENVPPEAFATELMKAVPLNAEMWAEEIARASADRNADVTSLIRSKGYDIGAVAERIEKSYRGSE